MFAFDHIAIGCERLEQGVVDVSEALGVPLAAGGSHAAFGTHNALLSLGGREYLEVIAVDPAAPPPGRARWFDLDRFAGPPRPVAWILSCDDLGAALDRLGPLAGLPVALSRGDFRWRMAVPEDGRLPFDNMHPALIEWQGPHPAPRLPESGCGLAELVVRHPEAEALAAALRLTDPRIRFETGTAGLQAVIATPAGPRVLQ